MSLEMFTGKSVLVTGGTGTFGHEFIKTLLKKTDVRRVIVFSRDEFKQSEMSAEIDDPQSKLRFFIGDVRDLDRLEMAFHDVDYVVHAAALKQVPALEYNPFEAIKTNVIGTQNVIAAAIKKGIKKVVLVSTDKAANPANLYGASKLCAERLLISSNFYSAGNTNFSAVRYGNVIGSRGSILQVISKQIPTGTVTLTHEDMTRFWITIDQGVNLVLHALDVMKGGEIFIPKAPSMKVTDFLHVVAPNCKLKLIGIRPGEKMHEALITFEEARHTLEVDGHYVVLPEFADWEHFDEYRKNGKPLPDNFSFDSNTNSEWLDEAGLKSLLANV